MNTHVELLLEAILRDRMNMRKNRVYDIDLCLPQRNYDLIKNWYQETMNYPITSIIVEKKEYPLNTLYGMDIYIMDLNADYMLKAKDR